MRQCKLIIRDDFSREKVEEMLAKAVMSVESVFGKPRVRIEGTFWIDENKPYCTIDISNEVGLNIAMNMVGYYIDQFGEEGFAVERYHNGDKIPELLMTENAIELRKSIDVMELSLRTMNVLKLAGIKTLGELMQKKPSELMRYRGMGKKSLSELKEVLRDDHGLTF